MGLASVCRTHHRVRKSGHRRHLRGRDVVSPRHVFVPVFHWKAEHCSATPSVTKRITNSRCSASNGIYLRKVTSSWEIKDSVAISILQNFKSRALTALSHSPGERLSLTQVASK